MRNYAQTLPLLVWNLNVFLDMGFNQVLHGCRKSVLRNVRLIPLTDVTLYFNYVKKKNLNFCYYYVLKSPPIDYRRKVRNKSNLYGLNALGYPRVTLVVTMRSKKVILSKSIKMSRSSNCFLKLENMKQESQVIVKKNVTVKSRTDLVHTARHAMKAG